MYFVEAIVLKRHDYRPHQTVLTLFSRDFGKFDAFYRVSRSSPKVDIAGCICCSVVTKQGKNTIREITKMHTLETGQWNYSSYEFFLWFLATSYRLLPEGNSYVHLFDDIRRLYQAPAGSTEHIARIIFLTLRLLLIFGIHQTSHTSGIGSLLERMRHASYEEVREDLLRLDLPGVRDYAEHCTEQFLLQT